MMSHCVIAHVSIIFIAECNLERKHWPHDVVRSTPSVSSLSLSLVTMTHQYDSSRIGGGGRSTPSVSSRVHLKQQSGKDGGGGKQNCHTDPDQFCLPCVTHVPLRVTWHSPEKHECKGNKCHPHREDAFFATVEGFAEVRCFNLAGRVEKVLNFVLNPHLNPCPPLEAHWEHCIHLPQRP